MYTVQYTVDIIYVQYTSNDIIRHMYTYYIVQCTAQCKLYTVNDVNCTLYTVYIV